MIEAGLNRGRLNGWMQGLIDTALNRKVDTALNRKVRVVGSSILPAPLPVIHDPDNHANH